MSKSVRVFAPATVSNLSCAFDILGFAIDAPGDELVLHRSENAGVRITRIIGDAGRLPTAPDRNTAGVALSALLAHSGDPGGFEIELYKAMPLGSGLGSSAASAAGALYGANVLLGSPLQAEELVPFALEAERVACGTGHADNAAPALMGGLVLIRSYSPLDLVRLPVPDRLWCAITCPDIEVRTEDARSALSPNVEFSAAVTQWGNVAGLVAGLMSSDYQLIGRSLNDVVVEPQRSALVPGFGAARKAAQESGALGAGLSGSGPSVFALTDDEAIAHRAARAMAGAFADIQIDSDCYVSKVNQQGPRVLEH